MGGRNNMSLTIPTDSLNKFLAIGSIVALLGLLNISLSNYEKAELSRIDAYKKALELGDACSDFCSETLKLTEEFELIEARYKEIKDSKPVNLKALKEFKEDNDKILKKIKELEPLKKQGEKLIIESNVANQKMNLYYWMRNIWFGISLFSFIVLSFISYIGFKGWYRSEKNS